MQAEQRISPSDQSLRRINDISPPFLEDRKQEYKRTRKFPPVSILEYLQPTGIKINLVVDGVHRVQAALELNVPIIPYVSVTDQDARLDALRGGHNLDYLAMRAKKFRKL